MNNIRKSELKQSVIAALSTFPCPVTVPEILHKLAPDDRSNLTRPELTELLEEMTLEGETEKFPVERYACHHVWTSTNKERRCSRCHRIEPIEQTEEEIMNTDIEVLTDSEIIASELLDEEEEQDRQKAIALKAEIIKLMADFFVALGEKLKICQEKRLYRFEAETFGAWCEQEVGIQRAYAYRLIRAYEIYTQIQNHMSPIGDMDENDYQNIPLPTSEFQIRALAQLPEEEWFPTWVEAVNQSKSKSKPPSGKVVEAVVREKKRVEREARANSQVERFKQGDIVRIIAKYSDRLKPYHHHWGIIRQVEEFGYTVTTYKGDVEQILHDDLTLIKQASFADTSTLLTKMQQLLESHGSDRDLAVYLQYIGTKPVPAASPLTMDIFNFLEGL